MLADQGCKGGTESETLLMVDNRENNVKQGFRQSDELSQEGGYGLVFILPILKCSIKICRVIF